MAIGERLLDVGGLEPPEPLFATLDALDALGPGEWLHLLHRREPFPLYGHLLERDCAYRVLLSEPGRYEALIWRLDDPVAGAACTGDAAADGAP